MLFEQIRTDSSDLLSQRLRGCGYVIESDCYPHTQVITANRVLVRRMSISYRVEAGNELVITYLESQLPSDGEHAVFRHLCGKEQLALAKRALPKVGLFQSARGLCQFLDFVIARVPEIHQGKAIIHCLAGHGFHGHSGDELQGWGTLYDYRQRVTTQRLLDFLFKWYGYGLTETQRDAQGSVYLACDFDRLRQRH